MSGSCSCEHVDLEDLNSVKKFSSSVKSQLGKSKQSLAVIVNNAGIMGAGPAADGSDRHLVANHMGHYLLTRLLLPAMTKGGRVVNVSSRAHYGGKLEIKDGAIVNSPKHWWWQYARSKLCNLMFTAELNRRYGTSHGIAAYGVSPGLVGTNIFHQLPGQWLVRTFMSWCSRTPAQGAETVVYAASSADLEGKPVLFLHDCKEMKPAAAAEDPQLAAQLWEVSEKLVGLGPQFSEQTYL